MGTTLTLLDVGSEHRNGFLKPTDTIAYWREHNPNAGFENESNSLISNIKKKPTDPQHLLRFKNQAIVEVGKFLRAYDFDAFTVVPVPPSKARNHVEYDDRLVRILQHANVADVRELVVATTSTEPSHQTGRRLDPGELTALWTVDQSLICPEPSKIIIFDDVLTRGAHFRAMVDILAPFFPQAEFGGLFIARSVRRPVDPD